MASKNFATLIGIAIVFACGTGNAIAAPDQSALHRNFDAGIHPNDLRDWMKLLAAEPNHVGSPHDESNANWVLDRFREWGWDAHIETFDVLDPVPVSETLELIGPKPFKATLQEPPIPGDSSTTATQPALPGYLAFQGDGDVTAQLVYVNYGTPDDYKALERLGINVSGAIVIARFGKVFRGLKPRLAQEHGAVGCVIYSDPADDGYPVDTTYPDGPMRPPAGIQRGSVGDLTLYAGDPLTPGVGSTKSAKRIPVSSAPIIYKIPAVPISYADAQVFLQTLQGPVAPPDWRGALPITYRVGPSAANVHLAVKSDWRTATLHDVIATLKGARDPGEWVIRGNHRDGWVFGATDPLSGQVAMLAEAKSLGSMYKQGWRPKRTIVYASWDGEEIGLMGSTEWVETHAAELQQHAVLYINSDSNARGIIQADGSQDLGHFFNEIADDITDPETGATIGQRYRAKLRVDAVSPHASEDAKAKAKLAADAQSDFPVEPVGSGSDYTSFVDHLGITSLNLGFGGESNSGGVYHSRYDTFEHHSRFIDPGFVYDSLLAKTAGWLVINAANSDLPLQQAGDFANAVSTDFTEVKKLADDRRKDAENQTALLRDHSFQLSADPTKSNGLPTAPKPVPQIAFAPLQAAVDHLKKSASAYDTAISIHAASLDETKLAQLRGLMRDIDQTLAPDIGLPGRSWYRNLIYAPGRNTGYGVKTLPGVREAIEDERFADADRYAKITADALNAYSARLEQATRLVNGK